MAVLNTSEQSVDPHEHRATSPSPSPPLSVRERARVRAQLLVLEAVVGAAVRELDKNNSGLALENYQEKLEPHLLRWDEISTMRKELGSSRPYSVGDESQIELDIPVFGLHNWPDPNQYLYQYTNASALPEILASSSVILRALSKMNDPQEALFSLAYQTGLMGPPDAPLLLSAEESEAFEAIDWVTKINDARLNIKIASFSTDAFPDLADIDPDLADRAVPPRIAANRGYAHPRMWAQYGDRNRGVCLILDRARLETAVKSVVDGQWHYGCGSVEYVAAEFGQHLGFFDARDLLHKGPTEALLQNVDPAIFTKHHDWAHESEYRLFVASDPPEDFFVPIDPDVIVGLVLGPCFDPGNFGQVEAFARAFEIGGRVRALNWVSGFPRPIPVDYS